MIRTSLAHQQRLNLIGAVRISPCGRRIKLHVQSHWQRLSGVQVIAFVVYLLHVITGQIILLWDQHPMHRRRLLQAFLARHPRLHVYEFPTGAPELNPTEGVWTQISEYTASTAPHNQTELQTNVRAGVARTRNSARRLWACIFGSDLPWAR
jgi:transposase